MPLMPLMPYLPRLRCLALALLAIAATGPLAARAVQPSSIEAYFFPDVPMAADDDLNQNGELDCNEFARFTGNIKVLYPTTSPGSIDPVSGSFLVPFYSGTSQTVGFSYLRDTDVIQGGSGSYGMLAGTTQLNCSPTACESFRIDYTTFGTGGTGACRHFTGSPETECFLAFHFRVRRSQTCAAPALVGQHDGPGAVFDFNHIWAGGNGVPLPLCSICTEADLSLTKTDAGATVAPGGAVVYTLSYANNSVNNVNASINETVPANTTFAPGLSSPGWTCSPNNNAGSTCGLALGLANASTSGSRLFAVTANGSLAVGVTNLTNTACLVHTLTDPNPANDCATDTTPVARPDITLTKSCAPSPIAPGSTLACTLTYSNTGAAAAANVTLSDVVPANTAFLPGPSSAGWSCAPDNSAGSTCALSIGTVNTSVTGSRIIALQVTNPLPPGTTQIANTACAATTTSESNAANNCGSSTTPTGGAPDLRLTKTGSPSPAIPGGILAYTLTVTNLGNQGATGVVLSDTVPIHTTFSPGASSPGWACVPNDNAGSVCALAIGNLAGGGAGSARTFAVVVDSPLPGGTTQVANTACASAVETDSNPANNCGSVDIPTGGAPNLHLVKTAAPPSVIGGDQLTYTLGYSNTGNQAATNVVLTENVPAATTFLPASSTPGWVCAPNNSAGASCTLAIGPLAVGASSNATFVVMVADPLPAGTTQIGNAACLDASEADQDPSDDSASTSTPATGNPDLAITKTPSAGSAAPGDTLSYTLAYANLGAGPAANVVVTEVVPVLTQFNAAASSPGWVCIPGIAAGSTCTVALGTLAPGAGGSLTFAVLVGNAIGKNNVIDNNACVSTTNTDTDPSNDCASVSTPVVTAPVLSIGKIGNPSPIAAGGTLTYTITYANTGNAAATAVELDDVVPDHTTFLPASSTSGWICVPDNQASAACVLPLPDLAPGASGFVQFVVLVDQPLPTGLASLTNQACIAAGQGSVCASVDTPTLPPALPDLVATKTALPTPVAAGQVLTYTISLANHGDGDASAVVLSETVPVNTVFAPAASSVGWVCVPNNSAGASCTLGVGLVAAHSNVSRTFGVTVDTPLPSGTVSIGNTVCAASAEADVTPADNCGSVTTPVGTEPSLELTLVDTLQDGDFDGLGDVGESVLYTGAVTNVGNAPAVATTTIWPPDSNCELVIGSVTAVPGTVTAGNTVHDGLVATSHGTLAPGASATVTWTCTIKAYPPNVTELIVQGAGGASTLADEPSDDPATPLDDDPTRTPLDSRTVGIVDVPTLDQLGLALIGLLLGSCGVLSVRRSNRRNANP